jgi:hypothetical protein
MMQCRQALRSKDVIARLYNLSMEFADDRATRGMATSSSGINKYSGKITQPKSQGASQAMRSIPID